MSNIPYEEVQETIDYLTITFSEDKEGNINEMSLDIDGKDKVINSIFVLLDQAEQRGALEMLERAEKKMRAAIFIHDENCEWWEDHDRCFCTVSKIRRVAEDLRNELMEGVENE